MPKSNKSEQKLQEPKAIKKEQSKKEGKTERRIMGGNQVIFRSTERNKARVKEMVNFIHNPTKKNQPRDSYEARLFRACIPSGETWTDNRTDACIVPMGSKIHFYINMYDINKVSSKNQTINEDDYSDEESSLTSTRP